MQDHPGIGRAPGRSMSCPCLSLISHCEMAQSKRRDRHFALGGNSCLSASETPEKARRLMEAPHSNEMRIVSTLFSGSSATRIPIRNPATTLATLHAGGG